MSLRDDPQWLRVLAFLRALGAPEPFYRDGWPDEAFFATWVPLHEAGPRCVGCLALQGMYMYLAKHHPGIAATDLWRAGQIKLKTPGIFPGLSIEELERHIDDYRYDPSKPDEISTFDLSQ